LGNFVLWDIVLIACLYPRSKERWNQTRPNSLQRNQSALPRHSPVAHGIHC
jgi:hypothetical protein